MKTSYSIIWKILNILDLYLDFEKPPLAELKAENFKISETRFRNYLLMLQNAGYIEGVFYGKKFIHEKPEVDVSEIKITLKGIEFLIENSMMNKIAKTAKDAGMIVAEAGIDKVMDLLKNQL